ncbi:plasmid stabilization system (plasmid) [Thalassoporum mexicanum PCC 7367]|uniref:type II toxin-antitoxin system RelE/ParE family toxin n=1 Tax=Thalassoporum mexicanum TaxID=3457544 RepID=UPI00029FAF8B|nr:type II toxin-antitoxin system RelE/ParE family toxin [Pseudanabaena sp. PCC 7367]AFY71980.1 plasmid stabilization system [Pseudanabaena sp. PCC 7367]
MGSYRLTQAADEDFENIFDYGIDTFGLAQALKYQNNLKQKFADIATNPLLYPAVEHIRPGYRRCVYESHAIYYVFDDLGVLIVRILGQQDPGTAF